MIPLSKGKGYVESEFVYNRLQHRTWFQGLHFSPAICPQALPGRQNHQAERAGAFEKPNVAESILSSLFGHWPRSYVYLNDIDVFSPPRPCRQASSYYFARLQPSTDVVVIINLNIITRRVLKSNSSAYVFGHDVSGVSGN